MAIAKDPYPSLAQHVRIPVQVALPKASNSASGASTDSDKRKEKQNRYTKNNNSSILKHTNNTIIHRMCTKAPQFFKEQEQKVKGVETGSSLYPKTWVDSRAGELLVPNEPLKEVANRRSELKIVEEWGKKTRKALNSEQ